MLKWIDREWLIFVVGIAGLMAAICLLLTGCTSLPQLYQTVEAVATDEAATATVYKNAIQSDTNIKVTIDVSKDIK